MQTYIFYMGKKMCLQRVCVLLFKKLVFGVSVSCCIPCLCLYACYLCEGIHTIQGNTLGLLNNT